MAKSLVLIYLFTNFVHIAYGSISHAVKDVFDTPTELYLYAWPLVMSSLTRKSMFYLPDNIMLPLPVFPNPNLTAIVKPNVDTLYSACWLNHEKADELVLTVPDTNSGLYYLFPLMDAWTNIVESPGWRTTGKNAISVLIRGPFSNKTEPAPGEYDLVINSPTSLAYLLGRTNVANQDDLKPTQSQMFSYHLKRPSETSHTSSETNEANTDLEIVGKSNPVEQIFGMSARDYYNKFADLLITNPPLLPQDADIVSLMASEYGLVAGQPWQFNSLNTKQKEALSQGLSKGIDLLYSYPVNKVNGWTIPDMKTGNFSTDYYLRAYIGLVLYAANVPQDAVYFVSEMMPNAGRVYELIFSPTNGGLPPANQFWSVTLYSEDGHLVANQNKIYSVSSQQTLHYDADGSLRITISMTPPADDASATTNWLPAPQAGESFQLTLRVYWPKEEVLSSSWSPPAIQEIVLPHK